MTTTLSAHGGGAQPARIDSSGKVAGGAAMRVYGFASEAEALAAGFVCEGGPAMSVAIITDAQLASGAWKLDGDPFATVIYTAPDSLPTEGGFAVPVYPVNGWGSAPAPADPGDTLRADCTAYWKFDEASGTRVDETGNGNDATPIGAVSSVLGKVGNAVKFTPSGIEANSSYLVIPAPNAQLAVGHRSFVVWGWFSISASFPEGENGWTVYERSVGGGPEGIIWIVRSFGVPSLEIIWGGQGVNSLYANASPDGEVAANVSYFFVAGYDLGLDKAFVRMNNGTIYYSDPPIGTPTWPQDSAISTLIGGYPEYDPGGFNGWIDELGVIIGRTITQDEQDYLYNSGAGRTLYP